MRSAKNMISVIMDGIRDADMIIDYADDAHQEGSGNRYEWFKNHARIRIGQLDDMRSEIESSLGITDRMRQGDEIAEAIDCHLKKEIERVTMKYNDL